MPWSQRAIYQQMSMDTCKKYNLTQDFLALFRLWPDMDLLEYHWESCALSCNWSVNNLPNHLPDNSLLCLYVYICVSIYIYIYIYTCFSVTMVTPSPPRIYVTLFWCKDYEFLKIELHSTCPAESLLTYKLPEGFPQPEISTGGDKKHHRVSGCVRLLGCALGRLIVATCCLPTYRMPDRLDIFSNIISLF